jgi:hypothetical protein
VAYHEINLHCILNLTIIMILTNILSLLNLSLSQFLTLTDLTMDLLTMNASVVTLYSGTRKE